MESTNVRNFAVDTLIYYEALQNKWMHYLSDSPNWIGAYGFRNLCVDLAFDLSEKLKSHSPDNTWDSETWEDFVAAGEIYFETEMLEVWDWEYCPRIVEETMERWLEDGAKLQENIRVYHYRVLDDLFEIRSKIYTDRTTKHWANKDTVK